MANKLDYVELGLACADVCGALDRGMKGRRANELSRSVHGAIEQLTTWVQLVIVVHKVLNASAYRALNRRTVAGIQKKIVEKGGRNLVSRLTHAQNDKETIATWKLDLNRILHIFNVCPVIAVWPFLTTHPQTELAINTNTIVSDVHHGIVNTHTMVSDMHRNMLKSREGADDQLLLVSDIRTPFHHQIYKRSPPPRHEPGQRSRPPVDPMSYIYI